MREKKDLGDIGEKIAEKYLKDKGYKILDKNFRYSKLGEIDIVAFKKDQPATQAKQACLAGVAGRVIFFEVKARKKTGLSEFLPEDNITFDKQKKLIKLAQIYLSKNPSAGGDNPWQIDILAIEVYRDGSYDIRHIENAVGDFW
ncbi:MAG: YraN family protein [Patescibacteria group bacterium]